MLCKGRRIYMCEERLGSLCLVTEEDSNETKILGYGKGKIPNPPRNKKP